MDGRHPPSVYLRSTEKVYLEDVFAKTGLNEEMTEGHLEIQVRSGFDEGPKPGWMVESQLLDPSGSKMNQHSVQRKSPWRKKPGSTSVIWFVFPLR